MFSFDFFSLRAATLTLTEFLGRLGKVRDWDTFVYFFTNLPTLEKWIVGICIFGMLNVILIFVVAIFSDKYTPGA